MSRRGATGLAGILPIDKPAGMTSHDVVAAIRKASGEGRIGHAGTLDPAATGLLVVLVGPYTRLEPYLSGATKTYEARICFGSETDTDDAEGAVTVEKELPEGHFDPHRAQSALDAMLGESMQTPPAYSAIKVDGKVAHRSARSGEALALQPRPIAVETADLIALDAETGTWDVLFRVSKGTYVRALARDLGRALGTAAHLCGLRRTGSGFLDLDVSHTLPEAVAAAREGVLPTLFVDPVASLGLPAMEGEPNALAAGGPMPRTLAPWAPEGAKLAVTLDGRLRAVYRAEAAALVADVVLGGAPT